MYIIPVIDLCNGVVVHARKGLRTTYQPIKTMLCPSSDPVEVVRAYLTVYQFKTMYIADLDAITGRGDNSQIIAKLHDSFPALNFWIDAGFTNNKPAFADRSHPVIASETGISHQALTLITEAGDPIILSLDFSDTKLIGDEAILELSHIWPETIIVMSLSRVGSGVGPDLALLRSIRTRAPRKRIFAAGGIRNGCDLERLAAMDITGVLVASALHNGQINTAILQKYQP